MPAPAYWGSDEYVYREAATEMIKSELQKGRAVGICYYAVKTLPRMTRDEIQELIQKDYADKTDISEEDKMTRFELMEGIPERVRGGGRDSGHGALHKPVGVAQPRRDDRRVGRHDSRLLLH